MSKGNALERQGREDWLLCAWGLCTGAKGKGETRNAEVSVLIKRRGKET